MWNLSNKTEEHMGSKKKKGGNQTIGDLTTENKVKANGGSGWRMG